MQNKMKQRIKNLSTVTSCCCLMLATVFQFKWLSLFFFGEYPYPNKEDYI